MPWAPPPALPKALRDRLLADWVAQNRLAELRAAGFSPLGRDQGEQEQAGQQFQWQEEVKGTPNPLFRRIEVTVFDADGKRALSTLSALVQPLQ